MGKSNSKLAPKVLSQLVKETNFSKREIQKCHDDFIADYPDGFMTVDRLKHLYEDFFPVVGDTSKFAEILFRAYDTDGDGNVDFREFVTALNATRQSKKREQFDWIFSLCDLDSSGTISREEMVEVMTGIYEKVGQYRFEIIKLILKHSRKPLEEIRRRSMCFMSSNEFINR